VSGSFPLKSPQRVSRRNFTLFLAAIVGSSRVVCTPLLQGPRRKGGFCAPLRRYTPYTNNSRSNYQIRIHSRCFSLFVPHSFPLPVPIFSEKLPGSLLLARRFARARMNGDLSRRWERVYSP